MGPGVSLTAATEYRAFSQEDDASPESFREPIERERSDCGDWHPDPELLSCREGSEGLCCREPSHRQDESQDEVDVHGAEPLAWLPFKSFAASHAPYIELECRLEQAAMTATGTAQPESAHQNIDELPQHVPCRYLNPLPTLPRLR